MKLIDILKIIDDMSDIVIWEYNSEEADQPLYEGAIFNVPWEIAEMPLACGLDYNLHALAVRKAEDGRAILVACVKENGENN